MLQNEINNAFHDAGLTAGLIFGRVIERKYIKFSEGLNVKRVIFAGVGLGIYSLFGSTLRKSFVRLLTPFITVHGGAFVHSFLLMFFVTALWPVVMKMTIKK